MRGASFLLLSVASLTQTTAFTPSIISQGVIPTDSGKPLSFSNHVSTSGGVSSRSTRPTQCSRSRLMASQEDKEEKARVKSKLLTERYIRYFIFIALFVAISFQINFY